MKSSIQRLIVPCYIPNLKDETQPFKLFGHIKTWCKLPPASCCHISVASALDDCTSISTMYHDFSRYHEQLG